MPFTHRALIQQLSEQFVRAYPDHGQTLANELVKSRLTAFHARIRSLASGGRPTVQQLLTTITTFADEERARMSVRLARMRALEWMWLYRHWTISSAFLRPVIANVCHIYVDELIHRFGAPGSVSSQDLIAFAPTLGDMADLLEVAATCHVIGFAKSQGGNASLTSHWDIDSDGKIVVPEEHLAVLKHYSDQFGTDTNALSFAGLCPVDTLLKRAMDAMFTGVHVKPHLAKPPLMPAFEFAQRNVKDLMTYRRVVEPQRTVERPFAMAILVGMAATSLTRQSPSLFDEVALTGGLWSGREGIVEYLAELVNHIRSGPLSQLFPAQVDWPTTLDSIHDSLCQLGFDDPMVGRRSVTMSGKNFIWIDLVGICAMADAMCADVGEECLQSASNVRAKLFEDQVQELIDSEGISPSNQEQLRKAPLRLAGHEVTDIDACFEWEDALVIVSCKSLVMRPGVVRSDFRNARNASDAVERYSEELLTRLKQLNENRTGDNYDLRSYRRILGVVCTPFIVRPVPARTTRSEVLPGLQMVVSASGLLAWMKSAKTPRSEGVVVTTERSGSPSAVTQPTQLDGSHPPPLQ